MFQIIVTRNADGKTAKVEASQVAILVDHLKASASRHGFAVHFVANDSGDLGVKGYLQRDGKDVALWEITRTA